MLYVFSCIYFCVYIVCECVCTEKEKKQGRERERIFSSNIIFNTVQYSLAFIVQILGIQTLIPKLGIRNSF